MTYQMNKCRLQTTSGLNSTEKYLRAKIQFDNQEIPNSECDTY